MIKRLQVVAQEGLDSVSFRPEARLFLRAKAAWNFPVSCHLDYSNSMDEPQKCQEDGLDPPTVAILVRYWRQGKQQRFLLENVATRKTQAFTSFEGLTQALHDTLAEVGRE